MNYTESWTWTKTIRYYESGNDGQLNKDGLIQRYPRTYLHKWMQTYRDKVQAIKTDEQAAQAIQTYWQDVVREWQEHQGAPTTREFQIRVTTEDNEELECLCFESLAEANREYDKGINTDTEGRVYHRELVEVLRQDAVQLGEEPQQ